MARVRVGAGMSSESIDRLRHWHSKLLRKTQKGTSPDVLTEVRNFINDCHNAGRSVSDLKDRVYLRSLLRQWGEFIVQHSEDAEHLDLSLLPFEGKAAEEEEAVPIWQRMPMWVWAGVGVVILLVTVMAGEMAFPPSQGDTPTPTSLSLSSPTIEATTGATVVIVVATPTLIPTGEMPPDLTVTLAASPTDTPTSPLGVPTHTPTSPPTPDAVVNAEALNLRSGPGVVYDVLGVLKQGDCLKISGKDLPGDWLKVTCCTDGQEGWTACLLLQVNVDMAGVPVAQVPPTPTPRYAPTPTVTPTPEMLSAPTLLEPKDREGDFAGSVTLKWQWERPLGPDEYFSLRVRNEQAGDCHHSQVKEPAYIGGLSYCPSGEYYWQVAVVRKLCEECPNEQKWQTLSHPSKEEWLFSYQTVEPDEPWEPPEPPKPEPESPCDKPPC